MRVMIIHAGYRVPAGEDSVVANEAAALTAGGHDVRSHLVSNPVRLSTAVRTLSKTFNNRAEAESVRRQIAEFKPDIVHVHNTWFALSSSVVAAAASTGTPTVMTVHNYRLGCLSADLFRGESVCTACVGRAPIPGIIHGCYRGSRPLSAIAAAEMMSTRRRNVLGANVDRFVAPSRFMGDRLIDIGIPADRLTVKPHFVTDPGPRTNPPSASNEVLYIGRLAPGKGIENLLRAWELFRTDSEQDASHDLRLSIIGDGPLAQELHESAPRGVVFHGWLARDEVMARLLAARAFVFPSAWYEPFGMVLVEALSAGVPIVVTKASEAPVISAAPSELQAPIGDAAALAAAISCLDDTTVDAVGAANRLRFEEEYSEPVGLARLIALYEDVRSQHETGRREDRQAHGRAPRSTTSAR